MTTVCHLITGEYPPDSGGVADFSAQWVQSLAIEGITCQVWTAERPVAEHCSGDHGEVQLLPGGFGMRGLRRLSHELQNFPGPRCLLVQYVPHAFGWKAMNIAFAAWVWGRRWLHGDNVSVMFHEVAFPFVRSPLKHNVIAVINRLMAMILLAGCNRVFVSTPAWTPLLRRCGWRGEIAWLPIPSNIRVVDNVGDVGILRRRLLGVLSDAVLGHFGTYSPSITKLLLPALRTLLADRPRLTVLLLGRSSQVFRDELVAENNAWGPRVFATGELTADDLSLHLQACDVLVQPFPDGATTRRTSLMAGLAHGAATVTTIGTSTEAIWLTDGITPATTVGDNRALIACVSRLLDNPDERNAVGARAKSYYDTHFAIENSVATLLKTQAQLTAHVA